MLRFRNPIIQSPFVYLQAAGSDGSDGSSRGAHLRWDFRHELHNGHLAKGNLAATKYPTNIQFNRKDDFIRIYSAPYQNRLPIYWNCGVTPDRVIDTGVSRMWEYKQSLATLDFTIYVRFTDVNAYDRLKSQLNPNDPFSWFRNPSSITPL